MRRGPNSKSRKGEVRSNFYVPFAFYKGKKFLEATDINPITKGILEALANESNLYFEKLTLTDIQENPERVKETITWLYRASDRVRQLLTSHNEVERVRITDDLLCYERGHLAQFTAHIINTDMNSEIIQLISLVMGRE